MTLQSPAPKPKSRTNRHEILHKSQNRTEISEPTQKSQSPHTNPQSPHRNAQKSQSPDSNHTVQNLKLRAVILSCFGRRVNAAMSIAQEKIAADMVQDTKTGPKKIMGRFNRDAKSAGKHRHPDDSTRRVGVPERQQVRDFLSNRKRPLQQPVQSPQHAGQAPLSPGSPCMALNRMCDVHNWAATIELPPTIADMNRDEMYSIPMQLETMTYAVQQVHLTCWKFVNWLQQLASREVKVNTTLHIDGFHKMHVGRWMVLAIGTHCLQFYPRESTYRQSFRPLVLLLGKDEESIKQVSVLMLVYDLQSNIMIARRVAVSHEHPSLTGIEEAVQPFWDFIHRLQFLCESF